jgi:hypothetical protein
MLSGARLTVVGSDGPAGPGLAASALPHADSNRVADSNGVADGDTVERAMGRGMGRGA